MKISGGRGGKYVDASTQAWSPLDQNQRLDAYYHFSEKSARPYGSTRPKYTLGRDSSEVFIAAESLATLPEIAAMTINQRAELFMMRTLEDKHLEAEEVIPPTSLSEPRSPTDDESFRRSKRIGQSRKKKKYRPSSAIQRSPAKVVESSSKVRPMSAPARMTKRLPVRIYGSQFVAEVRALPEMPNARIVPKTGGKRGHNNAIFRDVSKQKAPAVITSQDCRSSPLQKPEPVAAENLDELITMHTDELGIAVEEQRLVEFTGTLNIQLSTPTPWASVRYSLDGEPVKKTSRIYRSASVSQARRRSSLLMDFFCSSCSC